MVETIVKKHSDILGEYVQLDDYNNKCYIFERASPYVEEKPGRAVILKDRVARGSNGWHTIM